MKHFGIIVMFLVLVSCLDKNNEYNYHWDTEFCSIHAQFDEKKYTEKQIHDTHGLIQHYFSDNGSSFSQEEGLIYDHNPIKTGNADLFKKIHDSCRSAILSLHPIEMPYWKNIRQKRLKELQERLELQTLAHEAFENPKALMTSKYASICPEIIAIINSKDTMNIINTWKAAVIRRYGDAFYATYSMKYDDRNQTLIMKYLNAREGLIRYEWWECVNRMKDSERNDEYGNFEKLFVKLDRKCDSESQF